MIPSALTLIAAVLAAIAVAAIPGREAIKDGDVDRYKSWGKALSYLFAVVILGLGGYVAYIWYSGGEKDLFDLSEVKGILNVSNVVLFMVLGVGLIANNVFVSRQITRGATVEAGTDAETHMEVVEVTEDDLEKVAPKKKVTKKVVKKATVTKKKVVKEVKQEAPAPKKVVKTKKKVAKKKVTGPSLRPEKGPVELIEDLPTPGPGPSKGGQSCPSCDTPVDHSHDSCPVCGEDLKG